MSVPGSAGLDRPFSALCVLAGARIEDDHKRSQSVIERGNPVEARVDQLDRRDLAPGRRGLPRRRASDLPDRSSLSFTVADSGLQPDDWQRHRVRIGARGQRHQQRSRRRRRIAVLRLGTGQTEIVAEHPASWSSVPDSSRVIKSLTSCPRRGRCSVLYREVTTLRPAGSDEVLDDVEHPLLSSADDAVRQHVLVLVDSSFPEERRTRRFPTPHRLTSVLPASSTARA